MAAAMVKRHKKKKTIDLGSKGKLQIPASTLASAAQAGGKLGQRARLAETMKTWKH